MIRIAAVLFTFLAITTATAHDNGQYTNTNPDIKAWFNRLASGRGLCCSFADGVSLEDVAWGTHENQYWVIIDGERYAVPNDAVITEPNKVGTAVVWPYKDTQGATQIRCFMPGSGT
jgi:hypothetical protein